MMDIAKMWFWRVPEISMVTRDIEKWVFFLG
jgi:hypothetical protein